MHAHMCAGAGAVARGAPGCVAVGGQLFGGLGWAGLFGVPPAGWLKALQVASIYIFFFKKKVV